jgi:catechol 2,3-dioxygenase-like lactoylglutathione lyase family enzyme
MPLRHIALRTRDIAGTRRLRKPIDPEAGGLDHFGIHIAPRRFPALRKRLEAAGVKVVGRRGRWSIYVKDPNGYTLELYVD